MPDRHPKQARAGRTRGQTTQLGLLLATVVIISLLATLQVTVAPNVQQKTEYNHAAAVLEDMENIHADTLAASTSPTRRGTTVRMGGDYPNYVILIQPPGPYGTLKTTNSRSVSVSNARAVNGETADYIDGSTLSYTTKGLKYVPSYNQYDNPPTTVVSGTTVYQQYAANEKIVASSNIVSGNQLNLITTIGDISTTRVRPALVYSDALSHSTETVRVTSAGPNNPLVLRVQSTLSVDAWRQMLAGEVDGDTSSGSPATDNDGKFIAEIKKDTTTTPGTIEIYMETGETYQLRQAKIGHRTAQQASFPDGKIPDAKYLTTTESTTRVATEKQTIALTVEVRDKFQNAVSGVVVDGSVVTKGALKQPQRLSTRDGTVTFYYTAPEITQPTSAVSSQTHRVRFELVTGSGQKVRVEFDVEVQNTYN